MDRRHFLVGSAAAGIAFGLPGTSHAAGAASASKVHIFTKHLQFIKDYDQLAQTAAGLGYEGLDLSVRDGGHVLPQNVESDLPKAVEAARKAGLAVNMITTGIQDAGEKHSEAVIKTAAGLKISVYRIGGWGYPIEKSIPDRMNEVRAQIQGIAELNKKYGICAVYQNHSGANRVGAPLWDLWEIMKDMDTNAVAVNYDIGHATVEGGNAWVTSARLLAPQMKAVTVKDFKWTKGEKGWKTEWCPLGEGMVRLKEFLAMLKQAGFNGPISQHFEYEPKESGSNLHDALLAAMKRDVEVLKTALKQ